MARKPTEAETEEYWRIRAVRDALDDLPDGAFFAAAEEMGVDVDDWVFFSEYEEKYGKKD